MSRISDQRLPLDSLNPADPVYLGVINDLNSRAQAGRVKYGTYLMPFNGRDALVDAYQESLDQVQYLLQAILELDAVRKAIVIVLDGVGDDVDSARELLRAFASTQEDK